MARVSVENGQLVVSVKGARKWLASPCLIRIINDVTVPLDNIVNVTTEYTWSNAPMYQRGNVSTSIPGHYYGGNFIQDGADVFYDLSKKEEAVVINLKGEDYERLIIGVDDPEATVALIEQALDNR